MPPRRSTHDAAGEGRISADPLTFASLPLPLAHRIFLALPVDARACAACVCRAWRDVLADPALWTRLDLSGRCGVEPRHATFALMHGARARGLLYRLDLSGVGCPTEPLLEVLAANAGSLRELRVSYFDSNSSLTATVEALVAAAPMLQGVEARETSCTWEEAPRVMRTEPPFALLRLSTLAVSFADQDEPRGMERVGPFLSALADVTLQPALLRVDFYSADTAQPALMGALVDAALSRRLRELTLENCTPPAAAPLARLLTEGSLKYLHLRSENPETPLLDAAGAALVAGALRVNTTLTSLLLLQTGLCRDMDAACTLLAALVGHPSLRYFSLTDEGPLDDVGALAAALAALVAADAPTLEELNCSDNALGDAGLAPIVEALACNNHLHTLDISRNDASDPFKRVLRALLAKHASLRELQL
jgi:hypothetical protein